MHGRAEGSGIRSTIAGVLWITGSVIAGEIWYGGGTAPSGPLWKLAPPANARAVVVDDDARAMLRFDRGEGWTWPGAGAQWWSVYHFRWEPGPARSRMLLNMHRPDTCIAAAGCQLLAERGFVNARLGHADVPFQAYEFKGPKGLIHVYYTLFRAGMPVAQTGESVREACLHAVMNRQRAIDQEVLQFAVIGSNGAADADEAFRRMLEASVKPAQP
jgi:hypothetical protein